MLSEFEGVFEDDMSEMKDFQLNEARGGTQIFHSRSCAFCSEEAIDTKLNRLVDAGILR